MISRCVISFAFSIYIQFLLILHLDILQYVIWKENENILLQRHRALFITKHTKTAIYRRIYRVICLYNIYMYTIWHITSQIHKHTIRSVQKKKLCDCTINTKYKTTVIIQLNLLLLRSITQYHNERRFWNLRCLPASRTKAKAPHSTGTSIVTTSSRQVIFRVTNVLLSHQIA